MQRRKLDFAIFKFSSSQVPTTWWKTCREEATSLRGGIPLFGIWCFEIETKSRNIPQECIPVGCVPPLVDRIPACTDGGCSCLGGVPARGCTFQGGYMPMGVPCYLSHHAFDVTCMLPPHQLKPTNSAAAYILLVGHVTCKECWDTTPLPCEQNSWHTLLKILPCPNFVAGGN